MTIDTSPDTSPEALVKLRERVGNGQIVSLGWQDTLALIDALEDTRAALIDAGEYLLGATSAYEQFVGRHNRRGHKDALFETRYADFTQACDRVIAAINRKAAP